MAAARLIRPRAPNHGAREAQRTNGKVRKGAGGLHAIVGGGRHGQLPHGISFEARRRCGRTAGWGRRHGGLGRSLSSYVGLLVNGYERRAGVMINAASTWAQEGPMMARLKIKEARRSGPLCRTDMRVINYPTFTSIALGFAFSDLGSWRFSTPSLKSAFTFSSSTRSGNVKLRTKLP